MLEFMQKQLLWAVVMPLGIAIVCMVIAWRPWKREGRESVRGWWGGPLAVGLGYLVGHVAINRWPAFPPVQPTDYLFLIAALSTVVGVLECIRMPWWIRWTIRLALSGAVSWWMTSRGFKSSHAGAEVAGVVALQAAGLFVVWTLTELLAERRRGPGLPLALSLLIATASVYFLKSSSGLLAQLAGLISATLGGAALVAMSARGISAARGMLAVALPLYAALILTTLYAWHDPPLPWYPPVVLGAAPLLLWIAEWRESVTAIIARVLLAVAPALVALVLLLWYLLSAATPESLY